MHCQGNTANEQEKEEGSGVIMDAKKIKAYSDIQRALGMIDGASYSIQDVGAGEFIDGAVKMIEKAVEVLME